MFRFVVLLTLVAQTLQLIACCESCCADSTPAASEAIVAPRCCHHDHDHARGREPGDESPVSPRRPSRREGSHHVCLATHVFYVREARERASDAAGQLKLAGLPTVAVPRLTAAPRVPSVDRPPLRPALTGASCRATLGVYLL